MKGMGRKKVSSLAAVLALVAGMLAGALDGGMGMDAEAASKKPLAVYFTYAENIDTTGMSTDAVSSASLSGDSVQRKMDNIQVMTQEVVSKKGAKTFSIQVKEKYDAQFDVMADVAREQIEQNTEVELEKTTPRGWKNINTIYLGTPIWWYKLPQPVVSFLRSNDFSGKTIYVYGIHEGSYWENNISQIRELCPGATVKKGITVWGDAPAKSVKKKANNWLKKIK